MEIDLLKNPRYTLSLASKFLYSIGKNQTRKLLIYLNNKDNRLDLYLFFAGFTMYLFFSQYIGLLNNLNHTFIEILYWTLLGILSSIGLGFGLHTGVLFLFPLIMNTCFSYKECNSFEYELYGNNSFTCQDNHYRNILTILDSFKIFNIEFLLLIRLIIPIFFWGLGTALGDVPPYVFSRLDRLSRKKQFDLKNISNSKFLNFVNEITINLLLKYKFWAILMLSAWPNMFFDLCGIAAGHYLIPFKDFLYATILGKAFIKAPLQGLFIISLFTNNFIETFIEKLPFNQYLLNWLLDYKNRLKNQTTDDNILSNIWMLIILILFLLLIKSSIELIAQKQLNK